MLGQSGFAVVALDNNDMFGHRRLPRIRWSLNPLVGTIAAVAILMVITAILARGFAENGFRLGSQLAWRYASFVFAAALVAGPLCRLAARLFPAFIPPESLSRRLIWGFCAAYGVYLLSVFLPNVIRLSAGATLMTFFGTMVVAVMAATAAPLRRLGAPPILSEKVRKVFLATATAYFWLCYALMALARISGPHRPDIFYDISLMAMIAALLIRYADRWLARRDASRSPVAPVPRADMSPTIY
jgi:hypothetical protein